MEDMKSFEELVEDYLDGAGLPLVEHWQSGSIILQDN